jgi:predicted DNA-binding protein
MNKSKCDDSFRVHLPSQVKEILEHIAERDGRKLSAYVRRVLEHHATVEVTLRKVEVPFRHS